MSHDEKSLEYEPVNKTFKDYFKPARKLDLLSFTDFLYGGCIATFKKHQKKNLELHEKEVVSNRKQLAVSDRLIQNCYTMRLKDKVGQFPETENYIP